MRFKFCGGLDCPDWLLAEIATMAKISAIKVRQLAQEAAERMVTSESISNSSIMALSLDTKLSVESVAAVLTSISWVLQGGARDKLDPASLNHELQQLGTPKEHAGAISRVYKERRSQLISAAKLDSLRLSRLEKVGWRVDQQVRVNNGEVGMDKVVRLELGIKKGFNGNVEQSSVVMSEGRLRVLLMELEKAREMFLKLEES